MFKKRRNEVPAIGIDLVVATGIVSRGHLGNPSLTGNHRCGEVLIGAGPSALRQCPAARTPLPCHEKLGGDRTPLISRKKSLPTATSTLSVTFKRDPVGRVIACAIRNCRPAKDAVTAMWTSELKLGHGFLRPRDILNRLALALPSTAVLSVGRISGSGSVSTCRLSRRYPLRLPAATK